jgi:hypothetical protein
VEIKLTKTPTSQLVRAMTAFRESFSQLGPAPGILLSLTEQTRQLTREVTAVTLDEYFDRLGQALGNGV